MALHLCFVWSSDADGWELAAVYDSADLAEAWRAGAVAACGVSVQVLRLARFGPFDPADYE